MTVQQAIARLRGEVDLPYVESGAGDGIPVVLLHAYADSWRSFESVLPLLPSRIRALAPTQRGHGDATKPIAGYAVADFAHDLVAFLDELDLGRAALVASSSAAFTALRVAADFPDRVTGLVLIGAPWSLRERAPSLGFVEAVHALEEPVDPAFVRDFVTSTSSERVPLPFLETMIEESLKVSAHVWKVTLDGLLAAPSAADLAVRVPTLIVWGDQDVFLPKDDQVRLNSAIPGSWLVVYEGAGHVVHWELPERVAHDVSRFVAELPR